MSSVQWPPALKTFINRTFAQCTDANRPSVEVELRNLIQKAFESDTLWSTDWDTVQLESLNKPTVKRKKDFRSHSSPTSSSSIPSTSKLNHLNMAEEHSRREKRLRRFDNNDNSASNSSISAAGHTTAASTSNYLYSKHVNNNIYSTPSSSSSPAPPDIEATYDPTIIDWDKYTIVGTSTILEKPYLRLTTLPDPSTIRPLAVLQKAFEILKKKWKADGNYNYTSDQFRSLRQDLTVQRIKTLFTVDVYQVHARIALEKGDLSEYNQCQSQLNVLYEHYNLIDKRFTEFVAYRILYTQHIRNKREFASILSKLNQKVRSDPYVSHALQVQQSLSTSNYTRFFKLYRCAPNMGAYIMDHFIKRERISALAIMSKAYHSLPLSYITGQLAFESDPDTHEFLAFQNAAYYVQANTNDDGSSNERILDCKAAHGPLFTACQRTNRTN